MRDIVFSLNLFGERTKAEIERGRKTLLFLMNALVSANILILTEYSRTFPELYKSGVRYRPERGTEIWRDCSTVLNDGYGDCEDLASWLCAEYRVAGIAAQPYIKWRRVEDDLRYHAVVRLPDGRIEDPSRALGMNGLPIVSRPVFISPE